MGQMMQILDMLRRLVERLAPTPTCGACLAGLLEGVSQDEVQIGVNELATERGFARDNAICGLCGEQRLTICKRK